VYQMGSDPDPRVSLANERTALAGLRTALGLVVAGVALGGLASLSESPGWFRAIAVVLSLLGGTLALLTLRRWMRVEQSVRTSTPLPAPSALSPLAIALAVVAVAVSLGLIIGSLN